MSDLEIKINNDVVKGIVSEKIRLAVIESMGGCNEMISSMVDFYLNQKVGVDGNTSRYDSDNKYTRGDLLMKNLIEKSMMDALSEVLKHKQEEITGNLIRYFTTKQGASALSKAFCDGFVGMVSNGSFKYYLSVDVKDKR
jgi:hypothetical protein